MTNLDFHDRCPDKHLLLQADLDGELDAAASAALAAHVASCLSCAELQARLITLSRGVRVELRSFAAPDSLRRRFVTAIPVTRPAPSRNRFLSQGAPFALGALLAACLVLFLVPKAETTDDLVSSHIRALQPGHLTDVLSTDQHTVKPWFDGRIDFAPPVKDLAGQNFPLIGGRLDYLGGHPVAALVYRRDKHIIDLFVWPDREAPGTEPAAPSRAHDGYGVVGWSGGGMVFRAVSDLNSPELAEFARDWKAQP